MSELPLQVFVPGMQVLQLFCAGLQPLPPQSICPVNAEPSALQVLSVDPSELQDIAFGMHIIGVHIPAASLQSAAVAQSSCFMY